MNRRQKLIVSITGIILVSLILLGLTYAYFLTRIDGNDANKSISVTTADLNLTYSDGNGELTFANAIVPGNQIKFKSGQTVTNEKTFSVINNGDDTEYVVFIDDVSVTYANNVGETIKQGDPTTFESNDFRFDLTCTIQSSDATRNNTSCNSVDNGVFPLTNESALVGNDIIKGDTHVYALTMEYLETGRNQSNDMNKTLSALINIEDINRLNPYRDNENSLAYNIIENSRKGTNGTKLLSTPDTKPIDEVSLYKEEVELSYSNGTYDTPGWKYGPYSSPGDLYNKGIKFTECITEVVGNYIMDNNTLASYGPVIKCSEDKKPVVLIPGDIPEKTLSVTEDDYGTSYYYRGNPEDNFVNFAGMCWKIVRIEGDGSIKLVLEDKNTVCNDTVDNDGEGTTDYKYTGNWSLGLGNFGYTKNYTTNKIHSYLKPTENADKSMIKYFYDFQTTGKLKDYIGKLKPGNWCLNDIPYKNENGNYIKLSETEVNYIQQSNEGAGDIYYNISSGKKATGVNPLSTTLQCVGTRLGNYETNVVNNVTITSDSLMYVGGLNVNEIAYSGFIPENPEYATVNSYLINNKFAQESNGDRQSAFWPMSLIIYSKASSYSLDALAFSYILYGNGEFIGTDITEEHNIRPAVSLLSGTEIELGGTGTIDNPYVIK